ncbi:uncharacterized protein LOC116291481 [Actinia tenebrosa]|uniref:Uncharacterized protein LOC116291481 n=1 Tax=Actinia tenebrosa TaxID=6105 RepID=A0A6P8HDL4_ACTTE|nr:uncharacterized protein LOC116291481 [Actinia tenebrosa]
MAMLLGINSPCSNYFCIWCECFKALLKDMSIEDWPIKRSIERCSELANSDGEKFDVKHEPLVPIEFTDVVPDTLHLMLRIRGKLLNQVACWAIEQKKKDQMETAMREIGKFARVKLEFYDVQDEGGKTTTKWTSFDYM